MRIPLDAPIEWEHGAWRMAHGALRFAHGARRKKMDNIELFKNVLKWARDHCPDLWHEYYCCSAPEKKQHLARKILIEKVKKEPDTELLISPALKEKNTE